MPELHIVPDRSAEAGDPDTARPGEDAPALEDGAAVEHPTPADVAQPRAGAVGELAWADPRTLIVGINIRGEVRLDRHFVRDIAERGVREPITVRRRDDGALVVRKGKRRTLGAIEAGCALVRVFIEPEPDPADPATGDGAVMDAAAQIERIVDQLGENHHRAATSEADEVRAHQQLLDLGLSAGQIARRTHVPTARVKATTAVARSDVAAAVLARYELTLDQAAVVADFDDGTEGGREAVKALTVTAKSDPAQFAHVAQQLLDQRAEAALHAARVKELTAAGTALLPDPDERPDGAPAPVRLRELRPSAADPSGTELTEQGHRDCPGHAAQVSVVRGWRGEDPQVRTEWWCVDPDQYGHTSRYDRNPDGGGGSRQPGPMTEQEKAVRRRVVANNKAWDSAAIVRRKWLREFLARKSAPKDAAGYIAVTLAGGSHDVRKAMEAAHPTACTLLGLPAPAGYYSGTPSPLLGALEGAGTARLTMVTLAVLLGAAEDGTSRNSWRRPTGDTRRYFTQLATWGYGLAAVEQLVNNPDPGTATDTDPGPDPTADPASGADPDSSLEATAGCGTETEPE
ncbi:chromosome partitioning protein ParB [uncultured Pseudonocardia sp.]|jgi:ParB family chromosome partitioning protein|uniref:ParB/RepB/Spo0J family partition protein n=1 Tax=uncultured Pseudonocardia sp. TaxID=211455 RepID=UPI002633279E|nr:chromosome partitioning protein ParB [uncultured Pseudonocardia sp.]